MKDESKSKAQLIAELVEIRRQVAEWEQLKVEVDRRTAELVATNEQLQQEIAERKRAEEALSEERNLLRALIDNLPDYIYVKNTKSRFITHNLAHAQALGLATPEEVMGKTDFDLFPKELAAQYYADEQKVVHTGQPLLNQEERAVIGPSGNKREIWVLATKVPVKDSQGNIVGLVGISRDITQRKQLEEELQNYRDHLEEIVTERTQAVKEANQQLQQEVAERKRIETALHESEQSLETILNSITDYVWSADIIEGNKVVYRYYSAVVEQITGYPPDYFMEGVKAWLNIIHPEDRAQAESEVEREFLGEVVTHEYRIIRPDGQVRWLYGTTSPTVNESGQVIRMDGVVSDITERKQAEAALQESMAKLAALAEEQGILLEHTRDFVYRHNTEGRFTYLSPAVEQITGYSVKEWQDMHYTEPLTDNPINEHVITYTEYALQKGQESPPYLVEIFHKDGRRVTLEVKERPYFEQGQVAGIVGVARDITDRRQAEEALERERNLLRTLIDNVPDYIYFKDTQSRFVIGNHAVAQLMGVQTPEELIGKTDFDFYPKELAARYFADEQQIVQTGQSIINQEEPLIDSDGNKGWLSTTKVPLQDKQGQIIGLVGVGHDISEQKRLEAQLRHAQKMEAIGTLAGGIAHDFNNMLTAIMGYAGLAIELLPPDNPVYSDIEGIQKIAQRAADLVRQLLAFARRQIIEPQILNLNQLIHNMSKMLHHLISEDIELIIRAAPDLGNVQVDPTQLEQVLVNLVVNAHDAMPSGGKLIIETANVTLNPDYTRRHSEVIPGEYVRLSVTDTGIGMTEEIQSHIFEPFFTTKEVGQGSGLGLATSFGIIKQSDGHIEVHSKPGQGTTVRVYLPRVTETIDATTKPDNSGELPPGKETLLLVEDDASVRHLTVRMLRHLGYIVLEAANGNEALNIIRESTDKAIDLLITDLVMPQMGGKDLADQLKTIRPNIKILFISGYSNETLTQRDVLRPEVAFLQKPFTPDILVRKVQEILKET